jgi:hypothetical protein
MLFRFTRIFVAIGLLGAVWMLFSMRRARNNATPPAGPARIEAVKITQFYANNGALTKGESTLLCYGVENAKAVAIAPLEEKFSPALSRCVQVEPQQTTAYTITAEGSDGKAVTQSLTIAVGAKAAEPPRILSFAGTKEGGRMVKLCYQVANAEQITVEPPVVPPSKAPVGCFGVEPARTTTYTLTATGAQQRKATKQVIVEVENPI